MPFQERFSSGSGQVFGRSHIGAKSIAPEGCSHKELAMSGAGFDDRPRVAASLLEAA
jgi:hypothetical protein